MNKIHFARYILFAFLLLTTQIVWGASSCRGLFQEQLQGYFKYDDQINDTYQFVSTDPSNYQLQNRIVGTVEYVYYEQNNKLMIDWINVHEQVRQKGISKKLIERLLQEYPEANEAVAYLTNSNLKIFNDNYGSGKTVLQSVQQTPYYKVFAENGFSVIAYVEHLGDKVILTLKKEESK